MSTLAAIRPDDWNFPLFLHVLGAMVLVGGTLAGASALALAREDPRLLKLGYVSLLAAGLPGWVLMFVAGTWMWGNFRARHYVYPARVKLRLMPRGRN